MRRGKISDRELVSLLRDYRTDVLMGQAAELRAQVPESTDRAAERAFRRMDACVAAGVWALGAGAAAKPAAEAAVRAAAKAPPWKLLLVGAVTVGMIGAAGYAMVPALRELGRGGAEPPAAVETRAPRAPSAYAIPSPGEGFTVTNEFANERIAARWFTSDRQQLLVQIAYQLPETPAGDGEAVAAGGLSGTLYEADELLLLRDGDVLISIAFFNAERQELLDYAALFAESNR